MAEATRARDRHVIYYDYPGGSFCEVGIADADTLDAYRHEIEEDPTNLDNHVAFAMALRRHLEHAQVSGGPASGSWEEVTLHFREAVRLNPAHYFARSVLSTHLERQGQLEEAIAEAQATLAAIAAARSAGTKEGGFDPTYLEPGIRRGYAQMLIKAGWQNEGFAELLRARRAAASTVYLSRSQIDIEISRARIDKLSGWRRLTAQLVLKAQVAADRADTARRRKWLKKAIASAKPRT